MHVRKKMYEHVGTCFMHVHFVQTCFMHVHVALTITDINQSQRKSPTANKHIYCLWKGITKEARMVSFIYLLSQNPKILVYFMQSYYNQRCMRFLHNYSSRFCQKMGDYSSRFYQKTGDYSSRFYQKMYLSFLNKLRTCIKLPKRH